MVSDWSPMEPETGMMHSEDNHADLFGGDLFSDELLDIYNSSEGEVDATGHEHDGVVPLTNDIPHILGQNGDASQLTKEANNNMGYDGLEALRSTPSMNDFTSILEDGHSPTKPISMDTMLLQKNTNVIQSVAVSQPQAQSVPQVQPQAQSASASVSVAQSQIVTPPQQSQPHSQSQMLGKKRAAEVPQSNPVVKKKTVKTMTKVANRGITTINNGTAGVNTLTSVPASSGIGVSTQNTVRRAAPVKNENAQKHPGAKNNMSQNASKEKGENGTPDPLVLQAQAAAAAAQKAAAIATANANQPKIQTTLPVSVPQQPPVHAQPTYQTKTPQLVATNHAPKLNVVPSGAATVSTVKTEESFKGVAQAAVNNLILSAGQGASRYDTQKNESNPFVKPVDTSTSHVAALTSNNWVAACAASISDAPPGTAEAAQAAALAAASDPAAAKAARARRATLTADERARQNRDRNREHARNTRLRKKAYVEELKRTLTELVTARDAGELERRHEKQRELEVREVRYRVMEEFLKLRARGSENNLLARWVAILEDGFTLTLPRTDYRDMAHTQNGMMRQVSRTSVNGVADPATDPTLQVLRGATECFDDASKVAVFLQSLSPGNIVQAYNCDRKKFMMDGINAMLEWTLTSTGADNSPVIILKGCMRAVFSPASNKLICAELLFDSGSVVSQIKSLVPYQDVHQNPSSGFACIAETHAMLDSVLPQAPSAKQETCSVSVVSADKGDSLSDEECLTNQQCKQEPTE